MGFLVQMAIIAALAAGAAFTVHKAWEGFKYSIGHPYTLAQIALDQPKIAAAEKNAAAADAEAGRAHADTDRCLATAKMAGDQVLEAHKRADAAEAATKAATAARAGDKARADQRVANLTKQANAPPIVDQSCEQMRTKLRESQRLYFENRDGKK